MASKTAWRKAPGWPDERVEIPKMMEITAIGLGLMMTAVAVAFAGLMLEATLLMLNRALANRPAPHRLSPPPSI